jgi:hypothetical protein
VFALSAQPIRSDPEKQTRRGSEEAALDGGGGRDSDGVEESVNLLAQLSDTRLVFTYAEWLFRSSPDRAIRV